MNREEKFADQKFVIVSQSQAKSTPYPYIYVNSDGSVRELHVGERQYLETPFYPSDGARPYIKDSYEHKNPSGDLKGFCRRSAIPSDIEIQSSSLDDPKPVLSKGKLFEQEIMYWKEQGFDVTIKPDGTLYMQRTKN
jgi:hypothetical protein